MAFSKPTQTSTNGYDARALGYPIFTQGEDWADLKAMVKDAVACHFADADGPGIIRLHLVNDEVTA